MDLYQLLLAIVFAHSLHALGESSNVLAKLSRLNQAVNNKRLKPYPVNIDTRLKSYSLALLVFIATATIAYFMLGILDFTSDTYVRVAISLIIIIELFNTVKLDKYHVLIEKLIKKFSK